MENEFNGHWFQPITVVSDCVTIFIKPIGFRPVVCTDNGLNQSLSFLTLSHYTHTMPTYPFPAAAQLAGLVLEKGAELQVENEQLKKKLKELQEAVSNANTRALRFEKDKKELQVGSL
jgi:hypothetical protein